MKKILIASILAAGFAGSAMAVDFSRPSPTIPGPAATVHSQVVLSATSLGGNGSTSVSKAGAFAVGNGSTGSQAINSLAVTTPVCFDIHGHSVTVPVTATATGTGQHVFGEANTMGGSYASNESTGTGSGSALAYSYARSDVAHAVGINGGAPTAEDTIGGSATSITQTLANAGTNQSRTAFAKHEGASFDSYAVTGKVDVTVPGLLWDVSIFKGPGTVGKVETDAGKSFQSYSMNETCRGLSCSSGAGTFTAANWTGTGSNTIGYGSSFINTGGVTQPPGQTGQNLNNGFGNGDQHAPGNSGPNNNAENAQ